MIGILTEKASAAKNFAAALGGMTGNFNGEDYTICHSVGHIYGYLDPKLQVDTSLSAKYADWSIANLPWNYKDFSWKKGLAVDKKDVAAKIKATLSKCDEIVIATDLDPSKEGDMIGWEIISSLRLLGKKISRMDFYDEEKKSLQEAFIKRRKLGKMEDDKDYQVAEYRSKFDFLSMQFTRAASGLCGYHTVLRQGRLKSAMVVLIGDQIKAYEEYKPVPFFVNKFKDTNGHIFSSEDAVAYKTEAEVPNNLEESTVVVDGKTSKKKSPPKLIDLSSIVSYFAPKGYSADTVLNVYQKGYEACYFSYPRTEDKTITPEQFNQLLPYVDTIADIVGIDKKLLTRREPRKTHVKKGGAHGANRPGSKIPKSLNELEGILGPLGAEIYVLLSTSYLSMLCEDYEYDVITAHLEKYPDYKSSLSIPTKLGYKAILADDSDEDDEEDNNISSFGAIAKPFVHKGVPKRPAYPTLKWLMKALEKKNVGTGATKSSTYAEVVKGKNALLSEMRGKISMTDVGKLSYAMIENTNIADLTLTEKVWDNMKAIGRGEKTVNECLDEVSPLVIDDIKTMADNAEKLKNAKFDNLNKRVTINTDDYYFFKRNGVDSKFKRVFMGVTLSDSECEKAINGEVLTIKTDKGESKIKLNFNKTYKGVKFIGFDFVQDFPSQWCGYTFSEDEKERLKKGDSIFLNKVTFKSGKSSSCTVKYGKTTNGNMGIVPIFKK